MREQQALFPRYDHKIRSWSFDGDFGRNFRKLVNLQMWCFGCDIRRSEGNLLVDYGFTRSRPPGSTYGSSRYSKSISPHHTLNLWGFGMVISSEHSALCIKRFERTPLFISQPFDPANVFRPHDLPSFGEPRTTVDMAGAREHLEALRREMLRYETFVTTKAVSSFRSKCRATAPKGNGLRSFPLPKDAWNLLG